MNNDKIETGCPLNWSKALQTGSKFGPESFGPSVECYSCKKNTFICEVADRYLISKSQFIDKRNKYYDNLLEEGGRVNRPHRHLDYYTTAAKLPKQKRIDCPESALFALCEFIQNETNKK
ncbi:hypothetical protein [Methylomonas sp. AM2-LC]|uniref:hypothetical protein n=1 Tax=Methylomonas sp. AM2-LC TaxID=3153301 RepID=UPI003263B76D